MRREPTYEGDAFPSVTTVVGGTRLRWSDSAPGSDARPLFLVNGIGANIEMWAPLRRVLGDRRTIAYDAPGTGESATSVRPHDMPALAAVASRVLDEADVASADVLGYSFGGFVAQELARNDDRVDRLILAATGAGWSTSFGDFRELHPKNLARTPLAVGVLLSPGRYYLRPQGQRLIRRFFGDRNDRDYSTADEARAARPPSSLGYWSQLLAASRWSSRSWLGELTMPTLVLSGERDPLATVAAGEYLARRLPNARQVVLPGVGHSFLLEEQPVDVARVIEAFLEEGDEEAAA